MNVILEILMKFFIETNEKSSLIQCASAFKSNLEQYSEIFLNEKFFHKLSEIYRELSENPNEELMEWINKLFG